VVGGVGIGGNWLAGCCPTASLIADCENPFSVGESGNAGNGFLSCVACPGRVGSFCSSFTGIANCGKSGKLLPLSFSFVTILLLFGS